MTMEELYNEMKMALDMLDLRFGEMDKVKVVIEGNRIIYRHENIGVEFDHEEQD